MLRLLGPLGWQPRVFAGKKALLYNCAALIMRCACFAVLHMHCMRISILAGREGITILAFEPCAVASLTHCLLMFIDYLHPTLSSGCSTPTRFHPRHSDSALHGAAGVSRSN